MEAMWHANYIQGFMSVGRKTCYVSGAEDMLRPRWAHGPLSTDGRAPHAGVGVCLLPRTGCPVHRSLSRWTSTMYRWD